MLGEGFITRAAANVSNTLKERGITSLGRDGIRNAVESYVENLGLVAEASEIEAIINNVSLTGGSTVAAAGFTAVPAGKSLKEIMSSVREAIEDMPGWTDDIDMRDEYDMKNFVETSEAFVNALESVSDENAKTAREQFEIVKEKYEQFLKLDGEIYAAIEELVDIRNNVEDEY